MIAGAAVLDLLKAVQRVRVQPAPLCRAVGLDVTSLDDSGARVSTKLVTRLLALAEQRARTPGLDCTQARTRNLAVRCST
jgi:hypothetical protein